MNKRSNIFVRALARLLKPAIVEVVSSLTTPPTQVPSDWFNQVQEEIEQVVLDAGLNDRPDARLREALQSLLSGAKESDQTETPLSPATAHLSFFARLVARLRAAVTRT